MNRVVRVLVDAGGDVSFNRRSHMDTNEPGTSTEPVPPPRRSHRSAILVVVAVCVGLVLLVGLNMK